MQVEVTPGSIEAFSTLILAVFTIVLAGATWLYYRQSKLQTAEMKKTRELRYEPHMKAGLKPNGPNFEIGFVNIGGGIATNVKAEYWVEGLDEFKRDWGTAVQLPEDIHRIGLPLDDSSIGTIGMSEEIESHLNDGEDTFHVKWSYEDARGATYKETQEFSILESINDLSESTEFYSGDDWDVQF